MLSVSMDNGFSAKIELDILSKNGKVERKTKTVKTFTDLHILSGQREMYEGYVIESIDCTPGREQLEFSNLEIVPLGKAIGGVDENLIKRAQIKRTIEAHLDKELRYHGKGIKVLSLFFIDEVKKYRTENGGKGIYAEMFEECYSELMALEKYAALRDWFPTATDNAHDGYFSQDKKGNYKNTKGDALDDYNTYNSIMRDKEWLLSFDCPLRFIFSHSALKEGWDNPNVFQVCTLIEQKSTFTCRQKVGRGLRLCVDQDGERIEDKDINLLHVMANESFAEFAETLQKEIEQETGMKFGILQLGLFSGMTYTEEVKTEKRVSRSDAETLVKYLENKGFITPEGNAAAPDIQAAVEQAAPDLPPEIQAVAPVVAKIIAERPTAPVSVESIAAATYTETVKTEKAVTYDDAKELIEHFEKKGYVSKTGKIKDTMKAALLTGTLDLPAKFEAAREKFETIISRANRTPPIRDASRDVVVKLKHQVVEDSPEFAALWERICQRTTYRVNFDHGELVRRAVKALRDMPPIPKARMVSVVSDIDIQHAGVTHTEREIRTADVRNDYAALPNILTIVSDETLVPRTAVNEILQQSGRVGEFFGNPRMFIESFIDIVRDIRHSLAVDGISYTKLAGQEYYALDIFDGAELLANLDKNAVAVSNSVYDYVIYDSETVEKPFAVAIDNDPDVRMFFKLPKSFTVDTPIGTYNPDWAVFLDRNGEEKLYFVLETKGSTSEFDLRAKELLKIHCGKRHFAALDSGVEVRVGTRWKDVKVEL